MRLRTFFLGSSTVSLLGIVAAACGGTGGASGGDSAGPTGTGGAAQGGAAGATSKGGAASGGKSGGGALGGKAGGGAIGGGAGASAGGSAATGGSAGAGGANASGAAGAGCASGTLCGAACVDTASDATHCGSCATACPTAMNATPSCAGGKCEISCQAGYAACDGKVQNGCKVAIANDPTNCGVCAHVCPMGAHGKPACAAGSCSFSCEAGFQDCDLDPGNGCEAQPQVDPNNCGVCGKSCVGACVMGACQCAGTSAAAKPISLDIFVMLDKSGSMDDIVSAGMSRWQTVTGALGTFFMSAQNVSAGLQYFPLFDPKGTSCDVGYYYNPAVPIGPLPGAGSAQLNALLGSMAATKPLGGTPTNVALQAALKYAADYKAAFKKDKVVVVLATDGQPGDGGNGSQGCFADLNNSAAAAMAGFNGTPSIPTYVIGVGSAVTNLDAIAAAGGTSKAFVVNDGMPDAFLAALKAIQSSSIGCEYSIPPSPQGGMIDLTKVNVQYTPGGGAAKTEKNVANKAACAGGDGWYYDDPAKPTKIELCPGTCATVQADASAKIDVVLGCDTKKE